MSTEIEPGTAAGEQAKAMQHLALAEREAFKVPGIAGLAARDVRRVGVVGAGTMGGGIAMAFANAGFPVTMLERDRESLERGLARVDGIYAGSVTRGSLSADEHRARMSRLAGTVRDDDLADCDLVIEAVFEDMAVKKELLGRLENVIKLGAIIATNTSYLDVDEIAAATSRPSDVVGLHFFSPANVMKLLEIVRGARTAPDVVRTALDVARVIGKTPIVVGVCHGFVGNRMLAVRNAANEPMLLEGATPAGIDAAFRAFGWPMGPFQVLDLAGLDISWRNRKAQGKTAVIADTLCERGWFGQKVGRGFYRYPEGPRKPQPDPEVEALIAEAAERLGTVRRTISDEEIIERTHYPMIAEGWKILEEGIASRASDIDLAWVNGYGFPAAKGGPLYWAEQVGKERIRERLALWR